MRVDQLDYGQASAVWVVPVSGVTFPAGLKKAMEARVWRDESADTTIISQGESVCEVVGRSAADTRRLTDLCTVNLPRITWIADLKTSGAGSLCLIQFHLFTGTPCHVPALELIVEEKGVAQAERLNPHARGARSVIEWLTDQCLLPCVRADEGVRAFVSAGVQEDGPISDAFLLHGRSVRVFIKKVRIDDGSASDETQERMVVDRVTRDRLRAGGPPIRLMSGRITFCDQTVEGHLRGITQAQLMSLAESDESFMRVWEKYGEAEEEWVLRGIRTVGVMRYVSYDRLPRNKMRFDLCAPVPDALTSSDELEAAEEAPTIIEDPEMTWASYDARDRAQEAASSPNSRFFGRVDEMTKAGSNFLVLQVARDCRELHPPDGGCLFMPIQGPLAMFRRRKNAKDRIRAGACPMPQLGLLIEGEPVPVARPTRHPDLTPKVKKKVFPHGATPRQEEAMRVALNTPDIALIQGPPGTGKTTVIAAIIERLNEIADSSHGVAGNFLITGFQHSAVENAMARLLVNDLPAIKFGRPSGGGADGYSEWEQTLAHWASAKARDVSENLPDHLRRNVHGRLGKIMGSYVQAPGSEMQTIRMLDEVAKHVRDRIPIRLMHELQEVRRRLVPAPLLSDRLDLTIRAVRGIRTSECSFLDDGPEAAYKALRRLTDLSVLSEDELRLLRQASDWQADDGPPSFLTPLQELRRRLLLRLIPSEVPQQPKVRQAVASVLRKVVDALEAERRKAADAPELAAAEFLHELENNPEAVKKAVTQYTAVYAATCQQTAARTVTERIAVIKDDPHVTYDTVLADEAARSTPLDLLIPMAQARRRIVLIGDHRQLPHIIDREIERELEETLAEDREPIAEKVDRIIHDSLFQRLFDEMRERWENGDVQRTVTLDKQFRMHPLLGRFINEQFYEPHGEGFESDPGVTSFRHQLPGYESKAAAWIRVPPGNRRRETKGLSKSRPGEAQAIAQELKFLIDSEPAAQLSFGVITFYSAQVTAMHQALRKVGLVTSSEDDGFQVSDPYRDLKLRDGRLVERLRVGTVDAFQGKEFDVVFLSAVRSNVWDDAEPSDPPEVAEKKRRRKYGHLMSPNRLCVSMSRQRRLLVVVGDADMLASAAAQEAVGPLKAFYELCQAEGIVK